MDASVSAKLVLAEEHSDLSDARYAATVAAGELVTAPPLLAIEVTNIRRQRLRRGTMNLQAAYDAHCVALAQMLGCDLWTDDQRLIRALRHV